MKTMYELIDGIPVSVERGVALLDKEVPFWREMVDWERLDVQSGNDCLGGQIGSQFGYDYIDFCELKLGLDRLSARCEHGFTCDSPIVAVKSFHDCFYQMLTLEWKKYR